MRGRIAATGIVCAAFFTRAAACPSCYGAGDNTPVTNGMTYAVVGMLIITGLMLGLIVLAARVYTKRAQNIDAGCPPDGSPAQSPLTI